MNVKMLLAGIALCGLFTASAQRPASQLINQLKQTPVGPGRFSLYSELGDYYAARKMDSAVYFISEAIKLADELHDKKNQSLFLLQLGMLNEQHGNRDVAYRLVSQAFVGLRVINDKDALARAYAELGLLEGERKQAGQSRTDLDKAIDLFRQVRDTAGLVQSYIDLGEVKELQGDTTGALGFYLKAVQANGRRTLVNRRFIELMAHIGALYIRRGDSRTALRYLEEGIQRADKAQLIDSEAQLLDQEGKAYEQLGNKQKALAFYKRELDKAKQYQLPFDQAKALVSIAGVLKNQDSKTSLADLQAALHIAASLQDKELAANIYQAMSAVYQQQKNYKEALLALDEHHRLLDSLFGVDKARELAGLDSSYELVESRQQVGNLQVKNERQTVELQIGIVVLVIVLVLLVLLYVYFRKVRKLNRELSVVNKVQVKLFSVLGHDLRGPVASAVQMAELLADGNLDAATQHQMAGMMKTQNLATLSVLESLVKWGQVQLNGVKVRAVDFEASPLVNKAVALLQAQAQEKHLSITVNVDSSLIIHGDPDHFEVVIRNLLSNAIKFSKPGKPVWIEAREESGSVVVSVRDEGVGISPEKLHQFAYSGMETSFGTKGEKGTGLGLLLVKEFISANDGKIWAESTEGEGTTFYFTMAKGKGRTM